MTDRPSKSARKREYLALQALGEKLIDLTDEQLQRVPLEDNLREAVLTARTIRSHGALRRQRQLIGKLMARVDPQPIREAYEALGRAEQAGKAVFRRAEDWRDRILKEGVAAVDRFAEELSFDDADLRDATKAYQSSRDDAGRKRAARKVFRAVHSVLEASAKKPGN